MNTGRRMMAKAEEGAAWNMSEAGEQEMRTRRQQLRKEMRKLGGTQDGGGLRDT